MRYIISFIIITFLTSCLARSSYVDELAQKVATLSGIVEANSRAIYVLDPSPANLKTVIESAAIRVQLVELAEESSSVKIDEILEPVMSVATMIAGGATGTAVLGGVLDMFLQRSKNKRLKLAARKAANEPDRDVAHKIIDEAKA